MAIKWDIDKLIKFYNEYHCELKSNEYKNEDTYLTYICSCGKEDTKKFSAFKRSPYCKECFKKKQSERKAFTLEKVKTDFEAQGCVLLSDNYKNAWQYLDYICVCGNKSRIQFANFTKGVRCKGCPSKRKYTVENMISIMNDENCTYISQDGIDNNSVVTFICHCGRESKKTIAYFMKNKRCNECSHESFIEKVSGENSCRWNPDLTKEEREINRDFPEYKHWRNSVFERDNYTCQCCGKYGYELNAHHKDGYHWCIERRIDVSNGITLCEDCHNEFHEEYGLRNNTEKQFTEWMNKMKYELVYV